MVMLEDKLGKEAYQNLYNKSDDLEQSVVEFGELYEDAPAELKYVHVWETTIHTFPEEHREKMLAWLNEDEEEIKEMKAEDMQLKKLEFIPTQGHVIQLNSDLWMIFDNGLWREMTTDEHLEFSK